MPDFATFRDFAMPENSGIFRRNFPPEKMPPNPATKPACCDSQSNLMQLERQLKHLNLCNAFHNMSPENSQAILRRFLGIM